MKLSFDYNQRKVEFDVEYRTRKTLSIEVKPPGIVKVTAPYRTSRDKILEIVKGKGKWIVEKLAIAETVEYKNPRKEFISGEELLYLGKGYPLQLVFDNKVKRIEVGLSQERFVVITNTEDRDKIKDAVEAWYRKQGQAVVHERVEYYKEIINREPKSVKVKEQKRRWGSCTSRGDIYLNWKCIMAPIELIDYIVVHEMCHLIYMDHSAHFWGEVRRVLPDYRERREALKYQGVEYNLE